MKIDTAWEHFKSQFVEIPAAGGLVRNSEGAFLFIKRLGVWDLPKGKIEKKETPELAAVREVEEECGLSGLQVINQLDSTFHIYRSPYLPHPNNLVLKETKWFLMNYSGNEIPVPQVEEDIHEVSVVLHRRFGSGIFQYVFQFDRFSEKIVTNYLTSGLFDFCISLK